jgi:hypothetical protein
MRNLRNLLRNHLSNRLAARGAIENPKATCYDGGQHGGGTRCESALPSPEWTGR